MGTGKFLFGYFFHWEIVAFFLVSYVLLSSQFLAVTYIFLCCIVCISKLSLLCILVLSHVFFIYVPLLCQKVLYTPPVDINSMSVFLCFVLCIWFLCCIIYLLRLVFVYTIMLRLYYRGWIKFIKDLCITVSYARVFALSSLFLHCQD